MSRSNGIANRHQTQSKSIENFRSKWKTHPTYGRFFRLNLGGLPYLVLKLISQNRSIFFLNFFSTWFGRYFSSIDFDLFHFLVSAARIRRLAAGVTLMCPEISSERKASRSCLFNKKLSQSGTPWGYITLTTLTYMVPSLIDTCIN